MGEKVQWAFKKHMKIQFSNPPLTFNFLLWNIALIYFYFLFLFYFILFLALAIISCDGPHLYILFSNATQSCRLSLEIGI